MPDDRDTFRAVAWREVFPGLHLLSAVRLALNFRAMTLALLAIVLTSAGWHVCGQLFSNTQNLGLQAQIEQHSIWPWQRPLMYVHAEDLTTLRGWREETPFLVAWRELSAPFEQIFRPDISLAQWAYWLLGALWTLAVWALAGGAITRLAAVSFALQENVSWRQLAGFVRPKWVGYFTAPLLPMLATFLAAAFLCVVGLLMRTGGGLLLAGIVWPLVLVIGFLMAFLLLVLFAGWPLMWGAISVEGTDAFGALSHSYSYAYQRPLRYLGYVILAALVGLLGWFIVATFAAWILNLSQWGISWGSGQERLLEVTNGSDMGSMADLGMELISFWNGCLIMLTLAFVYSYFWSASTVIYFLLRRLVDATEIDEVSQGAQTDPHGLPPLKTSSDGVAEPADDVALAGTADLTSNDRTGNAEQRAE
ncbi:MAG TPA: hypothetical protein VHV08_15115 [Pirellulales bacterium]|nr:hypothetical protein [Pirellulales bacterium]